MVEFLSRGILDFKYIYISGYRNIGSEVDYYTLYLDFGKTFYFYPKKEKKNDNIKVFKKVSKALYTLKYKKKLLDWYDIGDTLSVKLPTKGKICDWTLFYFDFVDKDYCLYNKENVDVLSDVTHYVYKSAHYEKLKENFIRKNKLVS